MPGLLEAAWQNGVVCGILAKEMLLRVDGYCGRRVLLALSCKSSSLSESRWRTFLLFS